MEEALLAALRKKAVVISTLVLTPHRAPRPFFTSPLLCPNFFLSPRQKIFFLVQNLQVGNRRGSSPLPACPPFFQAHSDFRRFRKMEPFLREQFCQSHRLGTRSSNLRVPAQIFWHPEEALDLLFPTCYLALQNSNSGHRVTPITEKISKTRCRKTMHTARIIQPHQRQAPHRAGTLSNRLAFLFNMAETDFQKTLFLERKKTFTWE